HSTRQRRNSESLHKSRLSPKVTSHGPSSRTGMWEPITLGAVTISLLAGQWAAAAFMVRSVQMGLSSRRLGPTVPTTRTLAEEPEDGGSQGPLWTSMAERSPNGLVWLMRTSPRSSRISVALRGPISGSSAEVSFPLKLLAGASE